LKNFITFYYFIILLTEFVNNIKLIFNYDNVMLF